MNPALTLFSALPMPSALAFSAAMVSTPAPTATLDAPPSASPPALVAGPVSAETASTPAITSPFERMFAIGAYGTGWAGSYSGGGVGGRIRIEPWRYFGIDLFGEALVVETPHGVRHDHPIGFNIYVPLSLSPEWRFRPLLGMCVVASFIEAEQQGAPRADDVLVGAHVGGGFERALGPYLSVFAEAQGSVWMGHDRAVQGWTGAVGNDLKPFGVGQLMLGVTAHVLGRK